MNQQNPFKWRHCEAEIILWCVRWYLRYSLSYRDLEDLQGYEVMHLIRKGQMQGVNKGDVLGQVAFIASLFGVAA